MKDEVAKDGVPGLSIRFIREWKPDESLDLQCMGCGRLNGDHAPACGVAAFEAFQREQAMREPVLVVSETYDAATVPDEPAREPLMELDDWVALAEAFVKSICEPPRLQPPDPPAHSEDTP